MPKRINKLQKNKTGLKGKSEKESDVTVVFIMVCLQETPNLKLFSCTYCIFIRKSCLLKGLLVMLRLGAIGYGLRTRTILKAIYSLERKAQVVAITDPRKDEICRQLKKDGEDIEKISFFEDPDQMLDQTKLDGVLVGTRCSLHTKMAMKVISRGLPLFLEKPVATNMKDLLTLYNMDECDKRVVVSFPLRVTPLIKLAKEIVDSGKIGTVEHVQAYNNVPYGGVYYHDWYRDDEETGGLFLQKATHDFDYINYLLEIKPVRICAMQSKQVFRGTKPAMLKCDDCDEQESCYESPFHIFYSQGETDHVKPNNLMCCFAIDTGNEDSGSALIEYETGMHVAYSQNFFARRGAAKRGARLLGYKGTMEFDWYTDEIKVFMHHSPRVESYKVGAALGHGGGDIVLAKNFLDVIEGKAETSAPLSAGLLSVLMCLKARESARTMTFKEVEFPGKD